MLHEQALRIAQFAPNNPGPLTGSAAWQGQWTNQMLSSMHLVINGNDVTGVYTSASSEIGGGGPVTGDLKGYVNGDLISFIVMWPDGSLTAWTGELVEEVTPAEIRTLWHLVTDVPDADVPARLWTSTLTGADVFKR